jgi:hypothetical protein
MSTIDNLLIIEEIYEKCEFNIDLHNVFVDFKQAFDLIGRHGIINSLNKYDTR